MILSLTFGFLLWFFSPTPHPRMKTAGNIMLVTIIVYEVSRIVYHWVYGLT